MRRPEKFPIPESAGSYRQRDREAPGKAENVSRQMQFLRIERGEKRLQVASEQR